jgi:hypothetical protein
VKRRSLRVSRLLRLLSVRDRKQAYKAKGGKNSPENIAKRQQKRAEMRKKTIKRSNHYG